MFSTTKKQKEKLESYSKKISLILGVLPAQQGFDCVTFLLIGSAFPLAAFDFVAGIVGVAAGPETGCLGNALTVGVLS